MRKRPFFTKQSNAILTLKLVEMSYFTSSIQMYCVIGYIFTTIYIPTCISTFKDMRINSYHHKYKFYRRDKQGRRSRTTEV